MPGVVPDDPSWWVLKPAWNIPVLNPERSSIDTHTAQATVGDVNKGIINHKVYHQFALALLPNPDYEYFIEFGIQ
jgi:hypothetical protein